MDTRERILEAATELFFRYGIKTVTMDDISREIYVSKKTIYQYFKDKSEIVLTCTSGRLEQQKEDLKKIHEDAKDVIEELVKLTGFFRKHLLNMNPTLLYDMQKYYPKAWECFVSFREHCALDLLSETLRKGIDQGYFRSGLNIEIISRMRMENVEMAFNTKVFPPKEFELAEVQLQMFDHFIHGICTRKGLEYLENYQKQAEVKD
ncbi:TetR/AcrR family transcriptional regulator [Rapidithrix thailandica]|uniref:TetR/AcrR family transcriptional regulator n=1 Tax=Rapidithrix thailandica TaxID=413964 RepID=A0AAW9RTY7_9BACT